MPFALETAMRSVTGPHRSSNQDSVGCAPAYAFVADGVGGHVGGDVASWTVTHRLMALLTTRARPPLDEDLRTLIALANADLAARGRDQPALAGLATTFTGVFCAGGLVRVAHIGDSRAYLVRDGLGRQVTRDDSLVQMLLDSGAIGHAEAAGHPNRNIILRSLHGAPDDAAGLTVLTVPARTGDRWLLASDGLTDYVTEAEILATLAGALDREDAAGALVAAALAAGSRDNVTVAVSDVVDTAPATEPGLRYLGAAAQRDLGFVGDLVGPAPG